MHGTATPQQLSTRCIGTERRIALTKGRRTKNVQLDPFVRLDLVTAGCVEERAFPRYCVLTDNGNLGFPLAPPVVVSIDMTLPQAKRA